jgi:dihydroflavonol-4-reductase
MKIGDTCLVTGVSGYLGAWLAHYLLEEGFRVRGSVRSSFGEGRRAILRELLPGVELVEADLDLAAGWADAVEGCRWVFHVASPLPEAGRSDHAAVAEAGTRHVLGAAFGESLVEKIVVTSSEAAICFGHSRTKRRFSEDDWTPLDGPAAANPYFASKTAAERLSWAMAADRADNPRSVPLATINPSLIVGPSLVPWGRFSLKSIEDIAEGRMKVVPDMVTRFVDVRDCARMHIAIMRNAASDGERHFCFADEGTFQQVAEIIAARFSHAGLSPKPWVASYWVMRLLGLVSGEARSMASRIGRRGDYETRGRCPYRYEFVRLDEMITNSVESILAHRAPEGTASISSG